MSQPFRLRLFVAGGAPHSSRARANLAAVLADGGIPEDVVEVIDVLAAPQRAVEDCVLLTPSLIRIAPEPRVVLIGDLSDRALLAATLGLRQPS